MSFCDWCISLLVLEVRGVSWHGDCLPSFMCNLSLRAAHSYLRAQLSCPSAPRSTHTRSAVATNLWTHGPHPSSQTPLSVKFLCSPPKHHSQSPWIPKLEVSLIFQFPLSTIFCLFYAFFSSAMSSRTWHNPISHLDDCIYLFFFSLPYSLHF